MNQMAHSTAPACDSMATFADNVLTLMEKKKVSMAELSRKARIDRSTLHKSLNQQGGSFTLATCDKIAEALETTTSDLILQK